LTLISIVKVAKEISKFKMGSTQSSCAFVDVIKTSTYVKIKLEDGSFETSEIDSYIITTDEGDVITILDQEFNYAVKLGNITTQKANAYLAKKGYPILTNGKKFSFFSVFGHSGEHTMKDCFTFFSGNSVKSFFFAFNGKNNGFTISKKASGNITINLAFLKTFLGMSKTFDATLLEEFPAPKAGKAPAASSSAKVSSGSSWVSVAKSNSPPTLEDIQAEEVMLNAQLAALSPKKELAKKAAAEELKLLEVEEKANKLRELAIKDRQAKLKLALQNN